MPCSDDIECNASHPTPFAFSHCHLPQEKSTTSAHLLLHQHRCAAVTTASSPASVNWGCSHVRMVGGSKAGMLGLPSFARGHQPHTRILELSDQMLL
jgi:hypothetical protein